MTRKLTVEGTTMEGMRTIMIYCKSKKKKLKNGNGHICDLKNRVSPGWQVYHPHRGVPVATALRIVSWFENVSYVFCFVFFYY